MKDYEANSLIYVSASLLPFFVFMIMISLDPLYFVICYMFETFVYLHILQPISARLK